MRGLLGGVTKNDPLESVVPQQTTLTEDIFCEIAFFQDGKYHASSASLLITTLDRAYVTP